AAEGADAGTERRKRKSSGLRRQEQALLPIRRLLSSLHERILGVRSRDGKMVPAVSSRSSGRGGATRGGMLPRAGVRLEARRGLHPRERLARWKRQRRQRPLGL